ncbi:MAG: ABC transporter ATP-binding protein [Peptococcaceae bacterium]|jgi:ATP-binding cassette subfamily B protein|nr:ABC transporter ATP-binding protein/permease [Peptococcaceae bacterium]MDH7526290.1 ABC transporter ATP-binding protein [Peptococcaceae bacterium]
MVKLIRFLKPYRFQVAAVLVLVFFQSLSQLYLPTLMADIVDRGIVKGDTVYIVKVGAFMLVVAAGGAACTIAAGFLSSKTAAGFCRSLRSKVFSRVESYSLHEFDRIGTASLITRTTNDITQIQHVLIMALRVMVSAPLMCAGGLIMAVSKDAGLSLIIAVAMPVLVAASLLIARKSMPLFKAMQMKLDKLNLVLREGLTGIRVIRAFNRAEYEKRRFSEANLDLARTATRANQMMAALMPSMMLVMNFTTIAIIWFGGLRIENNELQVGTLMAFVQYVMQIMFSLLMVSMMFIMIPRASVSAARINQVLETTPEIRDSGPYAKQSGGPKGTVEFRNVTFSYPGAERPALQDISFRAGPGEVTAIIGGTGSGKSTLVNLIPRFYDIDKGSILVDGVDIREMPQEVLRAKIGYVPQKTVLFNGTIADNIRYGKEEASSEEIRRAAEVAQAAEFIDTLEDGFAHVVAQGGANVSGGQKQRLSIARALVRKPEIYIFDDSFSSLDFRTEARLRAALARETAGSTVLIVAQRVSTVMNADRIIVLDGGKIAGTGTHGELMHTCAIYREIASSQLAGVETA